MNEDFNALISRTWKERESTWAFAMSSAHTFLTQVAKRALGDNDSSRILCPDGRVKERSRAEAKILRKVNSGSLDSLPETSDEVEAAISDIVGVKVLCKSTRGLILFRDELCSQIADDDDSGYSFAEDPDDYVTDPKSSGYRAYHAVLSVPSRLDAKPHPVKVEVQVKTRLQDSWGELTHEDMYKPGEGFKPTDFHKKLAKTMADLLSTVDQLADDLAVELEAQQSRNDVPASDIESEDSAPAVVTVTRSTPKYALAVHHDGQRGLIPARAIKQCLVDSGAIDADEFIDVDDYVEVGMKLQVERVDNEDGIFYYPTEIPV